MDKFAKFHIALLLCLVFAAGLFVGLKHRTNKEVPVHTNQITLEYALGERVLVKDYGIKGKGEIVQGVVVGWGVTDWELTGKEEIVYFVETYPHGEGGHSAHGYKADEVTRIKK